MSFGMDQHYRLADSSLTLTVLDKDETANPCY
jgi:hypothetical protein